MNMSLKNSVIFMDNNRSSNFLSALASLVPVLSNTENKANYSLEKFKTGIVLSNLYYSDEEINKNAIKGKQLSFYQFQNKVNIFVKYFDLCEREWQILILDKPKDGLMLNAINEQFIYYLSGIIPFFKVMGIKVKIMNYRNNYELEQYFRMLYNT